MYVGLSPNKPECDFMVMNEHVSQCYSVAQWCVVNSVL